MALQIKFFDLNTPSRRKVDNEGEMGGKREHSKKENSDGKSGQLKAANCSAITCANSKLSPSLHDVTCMRVCDVHCAVFKHLITTDTVCATLLARGVCVCNELVLV